MADMKPLLLAVSLLVAAPALAEAPAPSAPQCTGAPASLPAGMEGWSSPRPIKGGTALGNATVLIPGTAADAALLPTPSVHYPVRPEQPGGSVSHGGLFRFTVVEAGRYRIALGGPAWIDLVSDGKTIASVAHGHGPECSGIRKMVDFDLKPGIYLVQIAGSGTPSLVLMASRVA